MKASVITLFPEMFSAITENGITARAKDKGIFSLECHNVRDNVYDVHKSIDDRPYGGGPGMVMLAEPLAKTIGNAKSSLPGGTKVIYVSPQGKRFDQAKALELSKSDSLIFIAGRYEGVDERVIDQYVDEELSLGDYVISGGELAVMVMLDAIIRLLPGALGDKASAIEDSFVNGLLDHQHYTRPVEFNGREVPSVLLSGDHKLIARWRLKQALGRTFLRRPDLLASTKLNEEQLSLLAEFKREL